MFLGSSSTPNVNACVDISEKSGGGSGERVTNYGEILVEKFHGISEKLLGHHRSDSDTSSTRVKSGIYYHNLNVFFSFLTSLSRM